jgi:hypothetical protein
MLLSRSKIIEGIIFPLLFFSACSEQEKPDSYVARVNQSYLTESDLSAIADSQIVSGKSRSAIIKNWVRQEILFQEAVKLGITETKDFTITINNTRRELASALLLQKFSSQSRVVSSENELENYYNENRTSFRLPFNSFFMNQIDFSDRETAVMFRTELIQNGWLNAVEKFAQDSSLINVSTHILKSEQDIYPVRLLRILEGLYPLEFSIVIPDDRGYYTVVQLLDKFQAQSIPPYKAVKLEVERRYKSALTELALENYIDDLYLKNEVEINK